MLRTFSDATALARFEEGTHHPGRIDLERLVGLKTSRETKISVCLPARNEERTVGGICDTIRKELMDIGLVDEVLVMDSRSTDRTAEVAARSGAAVHSVAEVLPDIPGQDGGKGEALWKSLAVASGDIILWSDADTRNFTTEFASRLLQPLLDDPALVMSKGFYERPIAHGDNLMRSGGARVTELVARPLLNLFYPELTWVIQPLSGEYAVRATVARSVPFLSGYAPDIGLLISLAEEHGVERITQVDLGTRIHRNQDIQALGRMAHQVMQGMLGLFDDMGRLKLPDVLPTTLTQLGLTEGRPLVEAFDLEVFELPPMDHVEDR